MKKTLLHKIGIVILLNLFSSTILLGQYNCGSITVWHNSTTGAFLCQGSSWGTPTRVQRNNFLYEAKNFQFWNYTGGTEAPTTATSNTYWTYLGTCCTAGTANAGSALSAICSGGTSAAMGGSIGGGATAGT